MIFEATTCYYQQIIKIDLNILGMGDILTFNNKLSFLNSVTILIVPFFLGIANEGNKEAHSEE
jgi:hypothetical protein